MKFQCYVPRELYYVTNVYEQQILFQVIQMKDTAKPWITLFIITIIFRGQNLGYTNKQVQPCSNNVYVM